MTEADRNIGEGICKASDQRPIDVIKMPSKARNVIVIGAGPAGMSAAIWLRRFDLDPIVLDNHDQPGGQLLSIGGCIPDFPGIPRVTGQDLARRLARHALTLGVQIHQRVMVQKVNPHRGIVYTTNGTYSYSKLIVASGSRQRTLAVPGEAEMIERGEVYSAARNAKHFSGQTVVMIGGGDRAVEGALLLAETAARVVLVHRSTEFRAQDRFVKRMLDNRRIEIRAPARVVRIVGSERTEGVEVEQGAQIVFLRCAGILVRIGVVGNASFLNDLNITSDQDFVHVDQHCRTCVPNIWAIGDAVLDSFFSSISVAVGHAAIVAKQLS